MRESTFGVKNPYCGWYQICAYTLSDEGSLESSIKKDISDMNKDTSMALLEINLKNYTSNELSNEALIQLEEILSLWSESDYSLMLRFSYDLEGNAKETEPDSVEEVCAHMKQVAPYVNKYKKNIYLTQGLFVGNWGEMHGTSLCNRSDFLTLFSVWSHDIDESIFVSVRTPEIWRELTSCLSPLSEAEAYSSDEKCRLALFNDGITGSVTDVGTYDEETSFSDIENYVGKGTRQEEISFQNQLCLYVPNGGEVVNDNEYNDIENAVSALEEMHVSYLNIDYDEEVLAKWSASEIDGENGLSYISKKLGYRYVIKESNVGSLSFPDEKADYEITIENTGFAPSYKRFATTLTLVQTKTKETKEIKGNVDNRYFYPGEESTISGTIDFSGLEDGYYKLYISMKDTKTGESIAFANDAKEEDYGYCLGQISLR